MLVTQASAADARQSTVDLPVGQFTLPLRKYNTTGRNPMNRTRRPHDPVKDVIAQAVKVLVNDRLEEQLDVQPDVDTVTDGLEIESITNDHPLESLVRVRSRDHQMPRYFLIKVSEVL
jgi:hypothetical protein